MRPSKTPYLRIALRIAPADILISRVHATAAFVADASDRIDAPDINLGRNPAVQGRSDRVIRSLVSCDAPRVP